jgi:NAD(P)-dependent dehydrogenase (short-subunit alcohol dehydrogenase family)
MIAAMRAESEARIPVGRLGTAEEIAAAVVMVASNA